MNEIEPGNSKSKIAKHENVAILHMLFCYEDLEMMLGEIDPWVT